MKLFRALILFSSFASLRSLLRISTRFAVLAVSLCSAVIPHLSFSAQPDSAKAPTDRANLIWIMADDLGYADLGCYGQKVITTPHIDRMAAEGMRFTHFYAGATVCAPSRSVLMTGLHHGHTRVRGNSGQTNPAAQALKPGDVTVAGVLQKAGYKTALIGKWGLGNVGAAESGLPRKHGFDYFYGYLSQHHAHNHFPDYLWRNESKEPLSNIIVPVGEDGAGYATEAIHYADDLFADDALKFVSENKAQPFFLYWSMVIPHANNERGKILGDGAHVPDFGPYADKDWPKQDKGQAAMITRLDSYVGRMMAHLKTLGLAENTLIVFTSDNGPHNESKHDLERFNPNGPYTGIKRSLTDGGIRVPVLTGKEQLKHDFLYWEFHEGGFKQAALYQSRWKGIRSGGPDAPVHLFDQQNDVAELTNVAEKHPDIAEKIGTYLKTARSPLAEWEPQWKAGGKKSKK
ncbi:arylsulfatase [Prosthecobacter sp.]|uniref:arylsulfatase n=1 Tax=Prosthecobacter sp. TaxID=1965333 RepID=UPI002AC97587|nr:arylsulfatase [Prosthecobacter sp.]